MKKMGARAYRLHKIVDFIGVIFLALFLLFLWQLYRGPIAVPFLKPYIVKALNHDDSAYQVDVESVNIELVRSIKPLKIIANNVKYNKADGHISITAPKTALSFSIRALLRGIIAPSSIEVEKPTVYVFNNYGVEKQDKEEVNQKKLKYYFDGFEEFLERFNSEDKTYPESYINDISIKNASVEIHEVDLGKKWAFSDLNYDFERNFTNIESRFNALIKNNGREASIGLDAQYRPMKNKLAMQLYFSEVYLNDIIENIFAEEKTKFPVNIEAPLNGKLDILINFAEILKNKEDITLALDNAIEKIRFQFEGGNGVVRFAESKEFDYKINGLMIEGDVTTDLNNLSIAQADFDLGTQKAKVDIGISGLRDFWLKGQSNNLKMQLKTHIDSLKFDELYNYWPRYAGTDAWDWCKESLFGGEIKNANFSFEFAYAPKSKQIEFQKLDGKGDIADVSLDYLTGMPRVTNMYGTAYFSNDTIKIDFDKAVSDNVLVNSGYVKLYDLDKYNNYAEIDLDIESSVTDALRLIDHKPLNYATEMGIKPDAISGDAKTKLNLNFEIKQDLLPEEVKVKVNSEIANVKIPDVIDKKNIQASKLNLFVDNNGLLVEGDATLDNIPIKLVWNENFANKLYQSKYNISFKFDEKVKKQAGIKSEFVNAPYINGDVYVDAIITKFDNKNIRVDVVANMQEADVDFSFLGLRKRKSEKGEAKVSLDFNQGKLKSVSNFGFAKKDFNLFGKMDIDSQGKIKLIDISEIKAPKTNAKAKIEFANTKKQKIKITVSGNSYDLSEFFAKDEPTVTADGKKNTGVKEDEDALEKVTDTDIFIAVNNLWTNEYVSMKNFAGSAKLRYGIGIEEMHLIGNFDSIQKKFLKLDYSPRPNKEYLLAIDSNDAGAALKFLRVSDNMKSGKLSINGKRDKSKKFIGHGQIRDFSMQNTPVLAKLLTVASFSGMVDMLRGEGITFSHFDLPFSYQNQILSFNEGKAFGNVMGITINGDFNRNTEELNIKGVIAPAYSLNNLIGKIPVVGNLLSGKDGTVFAANYTIGGNLDNPDISINPLSALSPSSLKDLFSSIFGAKDE